jgi:hypothetical protein
MIAMLLGLAAAGCRPDMFNQPRYKTYAENDFFRDGASARRLPPHTVARDHADLDTEYFEGKTADGKLVETVPQPVTRAQLERGRERFDIYCAVCHGRTGDGQGMIVQRGFPAPPSYHTARLRSAPVGHLYDVITNGYRESNQQTAGQSPPTFARCNSPKTRASMTFPRPSAVPCKHHEC